MSGKLLSFGPECTSAAAAVVSILKRLIPSQVDGDWGVLVTLYLLDPIRY